MNDAPQEYGHEYTIAVHEAGHTLMAYICGVRFEYVTIAASEPLEHGRLQVENSPEEDAVHVCDPEAVQNHILVCLAGRAAHLRDPNTNKYNALHSTDHAAAWKCCQRLQGRNPTEIPPGREGFRLLVGDIGCCATHAHMVRSRFDALGPAYEVAIKSLAYALLDRRTLLADQVAALLTQAGITGPATSHSGSGE